MDEVDPQAPLGALLGDLAAKTGVLVRQEVQLARSEAVAQVMVAGKQAALLWVGGALAHAGILGLLFAAIVAIGAVLPTWLAAVLVGAVTLGIGVALAYKSLRSLRGIDPLAQTRETLRGDRVVLEESLR